MADIIDSRRLNSTLFINVMLIGCGHIRNRKVFIDVFHAGENCGPRFDKHSKKIQCRKKKIVPNKRPQAKCIVNSAVCLSYFRHRFRILSLQKQAIKEKSRARKRERNDIPSRNIARNARDCKKTWLVWNKKTLPPARENRATLW